MSVPAFPVEIWTIVFEQFDFPPQLSVVRHNRWTQIRNATAEYEAGDPQSVANLPEFERSKWIRMRQYYNINSLTREAATGANFSTRWCDSFRNVLFPEILESTHILSARRLRRTSLRPTGHPPQVFHGTTTPEYLGVNVHSYHPFNMGDAYRQHIESEKGDFLDFAEYHPIFATLRRVDLILNMSRAEEEAVRGDVREIISCIEHEWESRGVRDGVVRIYWEFCSDSQDPDCKELKEELALLADLWTEEDLKNGF